MLKYRLPWQQKNALEAFIYEAREKVNGDNEFNMQVSTEEEREKIQSASMALEDWLYEDEATNANTSVLEGKLATLRELVYPILRRAYELENRPQLPEVIEQVQQYVNQTLSYVVANMTWVSAKEIEGVNNLTAAFEEWYANVTEQQAKIAITEEPAYSVSDAKKFLHKMQTEAQRLTKIKKIDPVPYSTDYSKYGGGYGGGSGGYNDPKMKAYYDAMYKNFSANGSGRDWFGNNSNFSNFSGWNNTDYMRSFYENMARSNFSGGAGEGGSNGSAEGENKTEGSHSEL